MKLIKEHPRASFKSMSSDGCDNNDSCGGSMYEDYNREKPVTPDSPPKPSLGTNNVNSVKNIGPLFLPISPPIPMLALTLRAVPKPTLPQTPPFFL